MKLVTIGCSFTAGVGVKWEKNYTSILSKLLNFEYDNWGAAGHSNQYIFRKTIKLLENFNENDILIIQWTNPNRDELITNEGYLFYPPFTDWYSLEFLYGRNPQIGLQKAGIFNKDEFDKKVIEKKKTLVDNYSINFYNKEYQEELSFCFQYALYGLLKAKKIKFIMFFGWEFETKKEIISLTDKNFLEEKFGVFTNTLGAEHPDEEGHKIWAEFLYQKIKEFNYI